MSHTHLTLCDRTVIDHLLRTGLSLRAIARRLNRHHSTIQREMVRNKSAHPAALYLWDHADRLARQRRIAPRHQRRRCHGPLLAYVREGLGADWSPEQIAGRLRRDHPRSRAMRVAPQTIYTWIYEDAASGGGLWSHLRRGHKKRRKQRRFGKPRGMIPGRVSLHLRPKSIDSRRRYGDWEGDTVLGRRGSGGFVTLVDRKSRYLLAARAQSQHAVPTSKHICRLLRRLPPSWRRSLTLDNGKEFSAFKTIESEIGLTVYFADPYASWQRGTNENTNGLIRQYLPKGINAKKVSAKHLAETVKKINHRPRKCLKFKTPFEVFTKNAGGAVGK